MSNLLGYSLYLLVTVLAEDEGNPTLSTTCFFFVTIGDINDNPPRFDDQSYEIHTTKPPEDEVMCICRCFILYLMNFSPET